MAGWRVVALVTATVAMMLGSAAAAPAAQLSYFGGPVSHSARLVLVYWGSQVRSTYTNPGSGDPAFVKYLASQSGSITVFGGVLAQYMDTSGHNSANSYSYGGAVQISPSVVTGTVTDAQVQSELKNDIAAMTLPAPLGDGLSTIYVVLFPPNLEVCNASTCSSGHFCSYHGSFAENSTTHVLYAAMVDDGPGSPNDGGCGNSASDIGNHTAMVTHEVAETINDPLVAEATGSGPPLAWDDPSNGEIVDLCGGQQALSGGWTVDKLWSNRDGMCEASEPGYAPPTASIAGPSAGQAGQQLAFSGSSSTDPAGDATSASYNSVTYSIAPGIASYDWNWRDGSPDSSGANATHTFAASGTYQVTLTVTDNLGFTGTNTQSVTIASQPTATTGGAVGIGDSGATLTGTVNAHENTVSYQFVFGTSPGALTSSTPLTAGPGGNTDTAVSAGLRALSPSTTYYDELRVIAGGVTYSGTVRQFTTKPTQPPQTPVPASAAATQVTIHSATLNGTINPGGPLAVGYHFAYGIAANQLTRSTPETAGPFGTTPVAVSTAIGGLATHTTYYFQLDAELNGQTYAGAVQSFTTLAPAPSASTGPASNIGLRQATVHGTVNPHGFATSYHFDYGRTTSYGSSSSSSSAGAGTILAPVSAVLHGLSQLTIYHYRLVATSVGGTTFGADRTFNSGRVRAAPGSTLAVAPRGSAAAPRTYGIPVSFTCQAACTIRVVAYERFPAAGAAVLAVTFAAGAERLGHRGHGTAQLELTRQGRVALRQAGWVKLIVVADASTPGDAPARPQFADTSIVGRGLAQPPRTLTFYFLSH